MSGLQYPLLRLNTTTVNPNFGGFYFLNVMVFTEYQKVQSIIQISLPRDPVYVRSQHGFYKTNNYIHNRYWQMVSGDNLSFSPPHFINFIMTCGEKYGGQFEKVSLNITEFQNITKGIWKVAILVERYFR